MAQQIPTAEEGSDLTHHATTHGIGKGDVVRSVLNGETAEAVEVNETGVKFDNGDEISHITLAKNVEQGGLEVQD